MLLEKSKEVPHFVSEFFKKNLLLMYTNGLYTNVLTK